MFFLESFLSSLSYNFNNLLPSLPHRALHACFNEWDCLQLWLQAHRTQRAVIWFKSYIVKYVITCYSAPQGELTCFKNACGIGSNLRHEATIEAGKRMSYCRQFLSFPAQRKPRICGVPDRRLSANSCPSRRISERQVHTANRTVRDNV